MFKLEETAAQIGLKYPNQAFRDTRGDKINWN